MCLRDVHLVSDALLGSDRWSEGIFHGYRKERAERMSALRTFAQFFHLAEHAGTTGGGAPRADPSPGRERSARAGAALETIHCGPALAPPFALDPQWIESTFGVRLGADPTVLS